MKSFEVCEVESAQDLLKIEISQHSQKKYDQIYQDRLNYICSYSWMNETDKYMIGTNSDAGTKKTLDDLDARRFQATNWLTLYFAVKITPLLIPIFYMVFK